MDKTERSVQKKILSILKTTGDFLSTFITTLIIMVAIGMVIVNMLGWRMFSVDSASMSPQYPINSLVIVKPTDPTQIQVGDVITYVLNDDGILVTHRVTKIDAENRLFTTKGDANNSDDALLVSWDNVVGKVILGVLALGKPLRFLTAKENRTTVIAFILIIFLFSFVWDVYEKRKSLKNTKKTKNTSTHSQ